MKCACSVSQARAMISDIDVMLASDTILFHVVNSEDEAKSIVDSVDTIVVFKLYI